MFHFVPSIPGVSNFPQPRLFQGTPTRVAATPLTQGARSHNYSAFGEFVSNAFRPGRLPEPAYPPPSMNCGTSQGASASSPTRPTGGRSGGKSQKQGSIQVSFMKNPKRKRLAKVIPHFPFFLPFFPSTNLLEACDACHKSKRRCDGTGASVPPLMHEFLY